MPRLPNKFQLRATALSYAGPSLIVAGLVALLLVVSFPGRPAMTALSILTLGATNATISRFGHSAALTGILLLHIAAYASLYMLFVGATLDAATTTAPGVLGTLTMLDLALSIVPIAIATRCIAAALRQNVEPQR